MGKEQTVPNVLSVAPDRKRSCPANKKNPLVSRSLPDHHVDDSHDNHSEGGDDSSPPSTANDPYPDALDQERFLTPVIRVTITSTAKQ